MMDKMHENNRNDGDNQEASLAESALSSLSIESLRLRDSYVPPLDLKFESQKPAEKPGERENLLEQESARLAEKLSKKDAGADELREAALLAARAAELGIGKEFEKAINEKLSQKGSNNKVKFEIFREKDGNFTSVEGKLEDKNGGKTKAEVHLLLVNKDYITPLPSPDPWPPKDLDPAKHPTPYPAPLPLPVKRREEDFPRLDIIDPKRSK